jgi:hypothetical protein
MLYIFLPEAMGGIRMAACKTGASLMTFTDQLLQFISSSSSIVVLGAIMLTGAAVALGVGLNSTERFLDARAWMEAFGDCLRSL